ncbi:slipin family protein [Paralimibaculum aggregatum]|uniref:Slipin family protein n=1 Tax=Paralimibaculum aggregatum TaxID=3036245 RepID=A0ABQ6LPZ6_9RHOB|nr:slipin family protein [Limibaculum sp. NKW23]GMG83488.1 slipin family protein [Limibaculum sp. NKW23]
MQWLIDWMLGRTRVLLSETERAILLENGRFKAILGPGEHRLPARGRSLAVERHAIDASPNLASRFERVLLRERPDLAEAHLVTLQAGEGEAAALFRDGALHALSLAPKTRLTVWRDAGPWEIRRWPIGERLEVPEALRAEIERGGFQAQVVKATVEPGQLGLLTIGGRHMGLLEPGVHLFWQTGRQVTVRLVDMRWRGVDVNGQEVLTRDRVTLRVNIAAQMRVVDAERAASAVRDFEDALHRALQFAFRRTLGARTLDQLLEEKVHVDAEAAGKVRAEMAEIGLEIGEIALKDVILPGEMREILNRVVAAEKEAEANVIRRREETAATRSLLNTAKVMAENPVMLRLKELEALESIAGKVESLTVHSGTRGLLDEVVRLQG